MGVGFASEKPTEGGESQDIASFNGQKKCSKTGPCENNTLFSGPTCRSPFPLHSNPQGPYSQLIGHYLSTCFMDEADNVISKKAL